SLLGWHKGVRQKKIEIRHEIMRVAEKLTGINQGIDQLMVQIRIGKVKGITFPGFSTVELPVGIGSINRTQDFGWLSAAEPPKLGD
ncbi:hypothetical protein GW17_00062427, partial [Ensete ventricosum]